MSDWSYGYVTDIPYTFGYYTELNPLRSKFLLLCEGCVPPKFNTACELAFGQGMSINFHATASDTEWYGTDFHPSHAAFAANVAQVAGNNAHIYDQSFEELLARDDLPDFDFIGMHGTWSWISDENRRIVRDFIRKKLKVGGVLYISYNTFPGFAPFVPVRELMLEWQNSLGRVGDGVANNVQGSLDFLKKLSEAKPRYFEANPELKMRVERLQEQNRNYLAHEYFNRDWAPMSFATMQEWLGEAKLNYVCSASHADHCPAVSFTQEQIKLIEEIRDPVFRESVKDFCSATQFRRDYYIRGKRSISRDEQLRELQSLKFILAKPAQSFDYKARGSVGEVTLKESIYKPLVHLFSDLKVHDFDEVKKYAEDNGYSLQIAIECLLILSSTGMIETVQEATGAIKKRCKRLNEWILNRATTSDSLNYLASPLTGGAANIDRTRMLLILARKTWPDSQKYELWAKFAWEILEANNQKLIKEGKVLESPEENLEELKRFAKEMSDGSLEILEKHEII